MRLFNNNPEKKKTRLSLQYALNQASRALFLFLSYGLRQLEQRKLTSLNVVSIIQEAATKTNLSTDILLLFPVTVLLALLEARVYFVPHLFKKSPVAANTAQTN